MGSVETANRNLLAQCLATLLVPMNAELKKLTFKSRKQKPSIVTLQFLFI